MLEPKHLQTEFKLLKNIFKELPTLGSNTPTKGKNYRLTQNTWFRLPKTRV